MKKNSTKRSKTSTTAPDPDVRAKERLLGLLRRLEASALPIGELGDLEREVYDRLLLIRPLSMARWGSLLGARQVQGLMMEN